MPFTYIDCLPISNRCALLRSYFKSLGFIMLQRTENTFWSTLEHDDDEPLFESYVKNLRSDEILAACPYAINLRPTLCRYWIVTALLALLSIKPFSSSTCSRSSGIVSKIRRSNSSSFFLFDRATKCRRNHVMLCPFYSISVLGPNSFGWSSIFA